MEVDEDLKNSIIDDVLPVITSAAAKMAVAAAGAALAAFIVTNIRERRLAGDMEIHPTEESVAISKVEAAATEVDGVLAQDKVNAVEGNVKASGLDATAAGAEATAADAGATALRTKAGASDIEVKALKMT